MKVWIATLEADHEPSQVIGPHVTKDGAKALCQAAHDQTRRGELEWSGNDRDEGEGATASGLSWYEVSEWDLAGARDADQALTAARDDIRARRRHFASLGANDEYLNALDDAYGLVNNRIGVKA